MTKVGSMDPDYMRDKYDRYYQEAVACCLVASPGAQKLGFDPKLPKEQFDLLIDKQDAKGKDLGRVQHNRDETHRGVVDYLDTSFNNWYQKATENDRKTFWAYVAPSVSADRFDHWALLEKARGGSAGAKLTEAQGIGHIAWHERDRNGNVNLHFHDVSTRYGVTEDKKVLSLQGLVAHANKTNLNYATQVSLAFHMEKAFGIKMEIDKEKNMAIVVGMSRQAEPIANDKAKAYLAARGLPVTPVSMTYARQNTREEKTPYESKEIPKPKKDVGTPEKLHGQSFWHEVYRDYIARPAVVIKAAWNYDKKREVHRINDVDSFLKKTQKTDRKECHFAALKAVSKTNCHSFLHALEVAEKAFAEARKPKVQLPSGAKILVKADLIKDEKQLANLKSVCMRNEWSLRVMGKVQEQEKAKDKQQEKGKER